MLIAPRTARDRRGRGGQWQSPGATGTVCNPRRCACV